MDITKVLAVFVILASIGLIYWEHKSLSVELANPASKFCAEHGGHLEIRHGEQGEYGVCILENGKECEEWAYFRGECG